LRHHSLAAGRAIGFRRRSLDGSGVATTAAPIGHKRWSRNQFH